MFNLFTHPQSNNNNSQLDEEQSSINLDFQASIRIKGEVLKKLLPWLLGGSIFAGGVTYGISNILPSSNTGVGNNNPSHTKLN